MQFLSCNCINFIVAMNPCRCGFFRKTTTFTYLVGHTARISPPIPLLLIIIWRVFLNNRMIYEDLGKEVSRKADRQKDSPQKAVSGEMCSVTEA